MTNSEESPISQNCCEADCACDVPSTLGRRDLLRFVGAGSIALLASRIPVSAGPFQASELETLVPVDKKLDPAWVQSLFARGVPSIYRGAELEKIGMPVGGITTGQLYLGGDGKLWLWDIFNQHRKTREEHYVHPLTPDSPVEQGFALITEGKLRRLDASGFANVSFEGQYPIGTVHYQEPTSPLTVKLEAFSPFIPLNADDSSLPVTIFQFSVKNTSAKTVEGTLVGWLQNAACLFHPDQAELRRNRVAPGVNCTRLDLTVDGPGEVKMVGAPGPDILFEDWSQTTYDGWTVEGTAFGNGPVEKTKMPAYQGDVGGDTPHVVNSHAVLKTDDATGKLTSRPFRIQRNYISFWIGGGSTPAKTCLNLVVDGRVVHSATGANDNNMALKSFDVRALRGKNAVLEIVDDSTGAWGNIGVGRIHFNDTPIESPPEELSDYGNLSLTLFGPPAQHAFAQADLETLTGKAGNEATAIPTEKLIGTLGRTFRLKPGEETTINFAVTWHFPYLQMGGGKTGRHYASRFDSAAAVATYVGAHFERLTTHTRLWRDTWYDSTLPFWLLDRTMANTSTLATSTSYRFANGRFYGWEGVGCCFGTCTHVWHYEQAVGRLFPELDIALREMVDYKAGVGFHDDGMIGQRGEGTGAAADGQAGTILRTYRDHQMSGDDAFLRRNWPNIKKAVEWMITLDGNADGIWEGPQPNTLDSTWYGEVAWLSGLYLAALRAGAVMASEAGDEAFALRCQQIFEAGHKNFVPRMWNGEYFVQIADPKHASKVGSYNGCEIDQVFGQSWAHQVGLGQVLPQAETKKALQALWKYNFTPDMGPYRKEHKGGRMYALAGEGGLLMCSWPRGEQQRVRGGFDNYFNECMTGFEHQVAGHMIWEGMVLEGLAVERMIHDRYHAARRNPYNEVECGDHYARAMASYGVFIASCGYEHHGPKAHLGFTPKISPEKFKAAFTSAKGWGSYTQNVADGRLSATVALKWGTLQLHTLSVERPEKVRARKINVALDGKQIPTKLKVEGQKLIVTLDASIGMSAGQTLQLTVS